MQFNKNKITENPFLLFLPFLLFYLVIILIFHTDLNFGDEIRYLSYAKNLTHGYYSLPLPKLDLGNGPGYSIIMMPFVALNLPTIIVKLLNAIFYYFSIVLLFKSLREIVPFKIATIFSLIWAIYPNTFEEMPYALPEVFTFSLIPVLIFVLIKVFKNDNAQKVNKYVLFAGLSFGYLALTKPIFGYVLIFMIAATILLWILNRTNVNYKKSITVLVIAFITTTPWLAYTYHMTGKTLYWSSFGGNNLYWMSTPFENEYGDWIAYPHNISSNHLLAGSEEQIKLQHQKDFKQVLENKEAKSIYFKNDRIYGKPYTGVIQDTILKRIAIQNIKSHPGKFIQNIISNAGRIIFNYPASYTIQKPSTLRRLPINGTILVISALCFIITLANWKEIPFPIRFLLFFGLLYFCGSLLGSAEPRMFTPIVPILLVWIAFILNKSVKIHIKFDNK